ncbi:ABC transporter permease [bacterium]|nr:ABC transporter permease [bacterium]
MAEVATQFKERVIRHRQGLIAIDFGELWRYRELFGYLTWRDIMVRYKQTLIGIAWAILQPLLTILIFTWIFSHALKVTVPGPYAIMAFAGLLPWSFFANAMQAGSQSVVMSAQMISKIYFPRLIIPTSATLSGLVDFFISVLMVVGLMFYYDVTFTWRFLTLPIFFLLVFAAALGVSLWLSALNVKYRDIKHVVPFIVRIGIFVCPVMLTSAQMAGSPDKAIHVWWAPAWLSWRLLFYLNPVVGPIDGFRWAILGPQISEQYAIFWPGMLLSALVTLVLLVTGAYYFKAFERSFADVI